MHSISRCCLLCTSEIHAHLGGRRKLVTLCAQTLERSYLLRINGQVVERPQHMLMRVSIGIHKTDLTSAIATYHLLSERWCAHSSAVT